MNNKQVLLTVPDHEDLRLRSIDRQDTENLRNWKNANKQFFFLNQDITPEQQQNWYNQFATRPHDHMFIVEQRVGEDWLPIGCMGFRKLEDEQCVDAYNIIRSQKIGQAGFTMSDAFLVMLSYAASLHPGWPLQVKVLSQNPAIEWYKKNGFAITGEGDGYVQMDLDQSVLKNISWTL